MERRLIASLNASLKTFSFPLNRFAIRAGRVARPSGLPYHRNEK
jgi:hypothetical protein